MGTMVFFPSIWAHKELPMHAKLSRGTTQEYSTNPYLPLTPHPLPPQRERFELNRTTSYGKKPPLNPPRKGLSCRSSTATLVSPVLTSSDNVTRIKECRHLFPQQSGRLFWRAFNLYLGQECNDTTWFALVSSSMTTIGMKRGQV